MFILGSGDIGLIMARRMTLEGATVLGVAELMPYSNGLNRNIQQCLIDFGIPLYLSHTVTKVIGKSKLEAIEISKVDDKGVPIPGTAIRFEVDTLLLSIGLIPNNDLLDKAGIASSSTRGAAVDDHLQTLSVPGIFAAGNVLHVHDVVDYVVAEGAVAGKAAASYLAGNLPSAGETIKTKAGEGIGYVVPAAINLSSAEETVEVKFRVRRPSKDVYVVYELNGKEIKKTFKPAIIPSEMEIVKLPKAILSEPGTLSVYLRKKEN